MSYKRVRLTVNQKIQVLTKNLKGKCGLVEIGKWAMEKFNLSKPLAQQTIRIRLKSFLETILMSLIRRFIAVWAKNCKQSALRSSNQ